MLRIWPHISHASYLSTSREASVIREHTLTGRHGKHPTAGYVQQRRLAADLMVHHAESTKHIPEVFLDIFFFPAECPGQPWLPNTQTLGQGCLQS